MLPALVAGPASKKTRAAPGFSPFITIAAARGVEADAQVYIGMPMNSITSMAAKSLLK